MGAACAPTYANLYLGWWERELVFADYHSEYTDHIMMWFRYIDDLFVIWEGDIEVFNEFVTILNINDLNLRVTKETSCKEINFLDLTIRMTEGYTLTTDMYRKPTSTNSILHAESSHLPATIRGVPRGEFLRTKRNCSEETTYTIRAHELSDRLRTRGYSKKYIKTAYQQTNLQNRNDLLLPQKKKRMEEKNNDDPRFVTRFNKYWQEISRILQKHWHVLQSDTQLQGTLSARVSMSWRRSRSFKDTLVSSHFASKKMGRPIKRKGFHKCGRCKACTFMTNTSSYVNKFGRTTIIDKYITCESVGVVYCIECTCGLKYIGKTKRQLKTRILEHIGTIRNARKDKDNFKILTSVARHFFVCHNCNLRDFKSYALDKIDMNIRGGDWDKKILKQETRLIFLMDTLSPKGLNEGNNYMVYL